MLWAPSSAVAAAVTPHFASLTAAEVNVRAGPGLRYPIRWVFLRRHMPVEIIGDYELWRKIRDWQGAEGWVHQTLLSQRRTVLVTAPRTPLRRSSAAAVKVRVWLSVGVVALLRTCEPIWCRVSVGKYDGWLQRSAVWGLYPGEEVN